MIGLLLLLATSAGAPEIRAPTEVTVRWTPPAENADRATEYRVRISALDYREIEFVELDSPIATAVTLSVRMTGEAVACAWAVGWRGQPAPPSCASVTIPGQVGDTPGPVEVVVGELAAPARDDRYQVRWPNAPSDFMLLSQNHFDGERGAPWSFTKRVGGFEIIQDSTAPDTPPNVGRAIYQMGFTGDGAEPFALDQPTFDRLAVRDLYVAFWLRVSENWRGHRSGVNKILHIWNAGGELAGRNVATLTLMGVGSAALRIQPNLQPTGNHRNLNPNLARGTIERGTWVLVELLVIGSEGAVDDGAVHVWLTPPGGESVKVAAYDNVNHFGLPERRPFWSHVQWAPTWGGRADDPIPDTQTMDIDGIIVMGR